MITTNRLAALMVGVWWGLSAASAQTWTEQGDAASFPDQAAQVTRGGDGLTSIVGMTGGADLRDAYCVRIVDPGAFLATTDVATDPDAGATFDTRLFLFDQYGAPVLANDDTPPSGSPFHSTLTGTATDGSGFVLTQPGEYVLVVAGFQEDPLGPTAAPLFDIGVDFDLVHAPDLSAGRFGFWEGGTPQVGAYEVALAGVDTCQNELDLVVAHSNAADEVCRGDGEGSFSCVSTPGTLGFETGLALGFLDADPHLDAVVTVQGAPSVVCRGAGHGTLGCESISANGAMAEAALGFVDGDSHLDVVLAHDGGKNQICLGDGAGSFTSCADVGSDSDFTSGVALGFVDADTDLDLVAANNGQPDRICLGVGDGSFHPCTDVQAALGSRDVKLGFLDSDGNLDAVIAVSGGPDRICAGDGSGGFTCSNVSTDSSDSTRVALGLVNGDLHLDAVFSSSGSANRICLGNGVGGFACSDVEASTEATDDVTLGYFDADSHLDAAFAVVDAPNRLCTGDGTGSFSCTDFDGADNWSRGIAAGELGSPDLFEDGFESGDLSAWSNSVQ